MLRAYQTSPSPANTIPRLLPRRKCTPRQKRHKTQYAGVHYIVGTALASGVTSALIVNHPVSDPSTAERDPGNIYPFSGGTIAMEMPVYDVRIVFQDLREARDPVHLRRDDGFDRQVDIPGLVAFPLLEYRMEYGFVEVVAGGQDPRAIPAPMMKRRSTMGMVIVFRGRKLTPCFDLPVITS
jgi:hypothetical protein